MESSKTQFPHRQARAESERGSPVSHWVAGLSESLSTEDRAYVEVTWPLSQDPSWSPQERCTAGSPKYTQLAPDQKATLRDTAALKHTCPGLDTVRGHGWSCREPSSVPSTQPLTTAWDSSSRSSGAIFWPPQVPHAQMHPCLKDTNLKNKTLTQMFLCLNWLGFCHLQLRIMLLLLTITITTTTTQ